MNEDITLPPIFLSLSHSQSFSPLRSSLSTYLSPEQLLTTIGGASTKLETLRKAFTEENNRSTFSHPYQHKKRSLHILLVEDTPSIAKVTSLMLKRMGHRVS